jgi:lipoate-protein ligase A
MSRIIVSLETNPYVNIACEYQLFLEHTSGVDLYLWQNDPCVVIGRNQNMHAEVDLEYLKANSIYPTRRFSGGGAVYQDLGNVNFTFIANSKKISEKDLLLLAQKAVKLCGIESEFSGRNDLIYDQKKFSGLAYFYQNNRIMFHGTMLVDVDLEKLTKALSPSLLKLKSKGIESVRNRVINLSSIDSKVNQQAIKDAFIDVVKDEFSTEKNIIYMKKEDVDPLLIKKLEDPQWIYGAAPNYEIELEKKCSFGNVSLAVNVNKGRIKDIKIYSDSLSIMDFEPLQNELLGVLFEEDTVFSIIEAYKAIK